MTEEKQQEHAADLPTAEDAARLSPDTLEPDGLEAERLRHAFNLIEAPEGSYEKVMDMTRQDSTDRTSNKRLRTHRMTRRAFLACAALSAVAVGTVAYAAANTDFFQAAFGDKGQKDMEARDIALDDGRTATLPARQWAEVDEAEAQRLVGDYVVQIGESADYGGYTLAIGSCVVDENGLGVASFTIEHPGGIQLSEVAGLYGDLEFASDCPIGALCVMDAAGTQYLGSAAFIDRNASTDSLVSGAVYFDCSRRADASSDGGVSWYLAQRDGYDLLGIERIEYTPTNLLPVHRLASADGSVTASISPLGLVLNTPDDTGNEESVVIEATGEEAMWVYPDWITQSVAVTFRDGTEYVVRDTDVSNSAFGTVADDFSSQSVMFNRLIDPATVASVTINAPNPNDPDVVLLP